MRRLISDLQEVSGLISDLQEKIQVYESLLHQIQLNAAVVMDSQKVKELIGLICDWSYAHRAGNGEPTEERIRRAFDRIKECVAGV